MPDSRRHTASQTWWPSATQGGHKVREDNRERLGHHPPCRCTATVDTAWLRHLMVPASVGRDGTMPGVCQRVNAPVMNALDALREIDCIFASLPARTAEFSMYNIPSETEIAAVCVADWL